MAADIKQIVRNLLDFFDFSGLTVITVGAGGGQFIECSRRAAKVIAVDQDPAALEALRAKLGPSGLTDMFALVHSDFMDFREKSDVVLFEFCLHEMPEPQAALAHALTLAPKVVVMDHWPGSDWAFFTAEEEKAKAAWTAVGSFRPDKTIPFESSQLFRDFEELWLKVHVQGEKSLARIQKYKDRLDFSIPMTYGLALLSEKPHRTGK